MGNLISRLFKIFKSGYVPKDSQFAPIQTNSPLVLKEDPSVVSSTTVDNTVNTLASEENKKADSVIEYDGDYKDLPDFVDRCYFDWMAGKASENSSTDESFERKIIEYLDVLAESEFAGANLIPRVPSVMVQLLKRTHEENVTGSELSRIIAKDVVLVAAILNEVNSSFYNMNDKVTELSQAILLLGHNRLRMVLAKISFTPVFNDQLGTYSKLTSSKLWEESQQRAIACYLLAKHQNIDPFMAFLAGLMQDVGIIVALRIFDRSSNNSDFPTATEFRAAFQKKSLILSARIGQIWTLPEIVTKAIDAQLMESTELAALPMGVVLKKADFISKTCILINTGQLNVDMEQVKDILIESEMDCLLSMQGGQISLANIM
ncbi:HDOD domain-containing protein [Solimicrobium silvestre]|uniref:HDOD domain n=1 Tax=Solimicrobium silvestre TaxID=2099400 RepID=A0A2S9GV59_9BURK|nr:HDOD domain-containing protein [Solimicrobium silvestre]PRC91588.1 HDOD domain [Solimicrobium silvestre]